MNKRHLPLDLKMAEKNCVHEFYIESPAGPTSEGKCRKCGAIQTFLNSVELKHKNTGYVAPSSQDYFMFDREVYNRRFGL